MAAGLYQVGLCGRSNEPIKTAETRLPANLCPLIKASFGHLLEESCPYAFFSDVVIGETTCDGKKKIGTLFFKDETSACARMLKEISKVMELLYDAPRSLA